LKWLAKLQGDGQGSPPDAGPSETPAYGLSYARTYGIGQLGLAFERCIAIARRDPVPYQKTKLSLADERQNANPHASMELSRAIASHTLARQAWNQSFHWSWLAVLLLTLLVTAGCYSRQAKLVERATEDCSRGDRWACDLASVLKSEYPLNEDNRSRRVQEDVDAILEGIERARSTPVARCPC
jgi:hypothetical protein